ncbi:MAG: protein translocase subunit SecD [Pelolinea sp.]|nr:protein translocase subunit SecD [Pelolinea sp.]
MRNKRLFWIFFLITIISIVFIATPQFDDLKTRIFGRKIEPVLGLDLRGGMQVVLESPADYEIDQETLQVASTILESRSNALGVSEVNFQVAGDSYIVGEFPGLSNVAEVIDVIKQTGLLEFVDLGSEFIAPGTRIMTDFGINPELSASNLAPTPNPLSIGQPELNIESNTSSTVYHTVITGSDLDSVSIAPSQNPGDGYLVLFRLKSEGADLFSEHTKNNVGKFLAIVLDKEVISTLVISQAITNGEGAISGSGENAFTLDDATSLRVTLFYGTLPVSLEIAESRIVGPSLGQNSLEKSLLAGAIGFSLVCLFMIIYYRAPGFVALVSIISFALINYAIYLLIPITLTLPGIAGFLLSIGSALDANILQFERIKEELRKNRSVSQAIDLGWRRAWPSIRDSNLATLITSAILFWFGSTFGASIVKGFALTLALGVAVSLITAIVVTRGILSSLIPFLKDRDKSTWFGI